MGASFLAFAILPRNAVTSSAAYEQNRTMGNPRVATWHLKMSTAWGTNEVSSRRQQNNPADYIALPFSQTGTIILGPCGTQGQSATTRLAR